MSTAPVPLMNPERIPGSLYVLRACEYAQIQYYVVATHSRMSMPPSRYCFSRSAKYCWVDGSGEFLFSLSTRSCELHIPLAFDADRTHTNLHS